MSNTTICPIERRALVRGKPNRRPANRARSKSDVRCTRIFNVRVPNKTCDRFRSAGGKYFLRCNSSFFFRRLCRGGFHAVVHTTFVVSRCWGRVRPPRPPHFESWGTPLRGAFLNGAHMIQNGGGGLRMRNHGRRRWSAEMPRFYMANFISPLRFEIYRTFCLARGQYIKK